MNRASESLGYPIWNLHYPCLGTDQCKDTRMCLYEPERQNTQLKIGKNTLIKSDQALFFFFFFRTGARSQLCSAVHFQGEMAGGWHRTTLPSVPISSTHGDVVTDVCEVERCSALTFCNPLHFCADLYSLRNSDAMKIITNSYSGKKITYV